MNLLATLAGLLTLAAFAVHAVVGAREFRPLAPPPEAATRTAYVQALAGWHWVSVSLLSTGLLFMTIGATDRVPAEAVVLRALAAYFAACGLAWLLTLVVSGQGVERRYLALGQWVFCALVAGLALAAA
ncbi:MAG: hypothetical protein AAF845_03250 [Bacteroidota bacterium]